MLCFYNYSRKYFRIRFVGILIISLTCRMLILEYIRQLLWHYCSVVFMLTKPVALNVFALSQFLWINWFNVCLAWRTIFDLLLKHRNIQASRLQHMTRACVCLSVCVSANCGSVGKFHNVWRRNNRSKCTMAVRCISRAGPTGCHVSLIRPLFGRLGCFQTRCETQQGHHSALMEGAQ